MKGKPRTENGARFAPEWTKEDYIKAVDDCLQEATVTASEVAEKMGCSAKNAKAHLLDLVDRGELVAVMKGRAWCFRFPEPGIHYTPKTE